jgi:hypothetical protein
MLLKFEVFFLGGGLVAPSGVQWCPVAPLVLGGTNGKADNDRDKAGGTPHVQGKAWYENCGPFGSWKRIWAIKTWR